MIENLKGTIFNSNLDFNHAAIDIFNFQYQNNKLYRNYVDAIGVPASAVASVNHIPFLPISFFKTHQVITTSYQPEMVFESSGTTGTSNSRHFVQNLQFYEQSFFGAFQLFYGNITDYCIIGLLPSYLERNNSSLVYMVNKLIQASAHHQSGFHLNEWDKLANVLEELEKTGQKTLLIGVTFALLDFAAMHPMPLRHTTVMETGGMKGRRAEMIREEVHSILKMAFDLKEIHSEYGMTELFSQAYSQGDGIFKCPPWMKIFIREEEDPLNCLGRPKKGKIRGVINIIDLPNIGSCSFIATDDVGALHSDGEFEVLGRMDSSDLRGCSLMVS